MEESFNIRALGKWEDYPFDLLRLADPDQAVLETYLFDSELFVLEESTNILGVLVLKKLKNDELEIMNLAIEEKQQGKGWGKVLLNYGIEEAKKRKAKSLWIATGNSSIGQLALYQKMGFEMAEIRWDHFVHNYAEPIWENGIQCKHMVRLKMEF